MKKYYITTPLYYVNAKPHIGHAYTNVLCDTFARFRRFRGEQVFFMTGTDEHGTKIEKSARDHGKEPQAYVDEIMPLFRGLWDQIGIAYDYFIRTTDAGHKDAVRDLLTDLEKCGEIYKAKYTGWYSIKSETFYTETELVDGRCPDTGGEVQKIEEENYFFKLSKYQEWLINYIQTHPEFIQPEMRRNEIMGFLREPLEDLCITRPKERLQWGIEYPGDPRYVVYVWFDALINYVSGAGYPREKERFASLWPADVHVVGKDILRHHAVYWPIMLQACGLEMPRKILAHGWWTMEGAKMSKSFGNVVDPMDMIAKYGVDCFRFFLLREVTMGMDGSFSEELLNNRLVNELGNDLGNFVHRVFGMLGKYYEGKIPAGIDPDKIDNGLKHQAAGLWHRVEKFMLEYDPKSALEEIWDFIRRANKFVEEEKPWSLAKAADKRERLAEVMYTLMESIRVSGVILTPFLPETAGKILLQLNLSAEAGAADLQRWGVLRPGDAVGKSAPLFPRIEEPA